MQKRSSVCARRRAAQSRVGAEKAYLLNSFRMARPLLNPLMPALAGRMLKGSRSAGGVMKISTRIRAGGLGSTNHNQTTARGLRVKANLKAGGLSMNHNLTLARR